MFYATLSVAELHAVVRKSLCLHAFRLPGKLLLCDRARIHDPPAHIELMCFISGSKSVLNEIKCT